MAGASFTISAFGDEIADDLVVQLQVLRELRISHLELRGVWGKNVLELSDEEATAARRVCADQGLVVSGIGSPLGKSALEAPLAAEEVKLVRLFEIAEQLGTRRVRVFSYYPPGDNDGTTPNDYVAEATIRLTRLTELAAQNGFVLLLENEKGIVGDIPERCHAILSGIDSPHLRFAWDPANFVQLSVSQPTTTGWPWLGEYVSHVHVKDASLSDGSIKPAGEGDGQVGELLVALKDSGYQGLLALEPHLLVAGHSHGFSGAEGMSRAAGALRHLMSRVGCPETES